MSGRIWLSFGLALALAGVATADPASVKKAAGLFEQGRTAVKAGDYAKGCPLIEESYKVDPTATGTVLNVADCAEHGGHLYRAWQLFGSAATEFDRAKDARAKYARERASALVQKLATIVLELPEPLPSDVAITVGDRELEAAPALTELFDPGDLTIHVTARDHVAFTKKISAAPGSVTNVIVELPPIARPRPVVAAVAHEEVARRAPGRVRLSMWIGAGGLVGLATGSVLALVARRSYDRVAFGPDCTTSPLVCTPAAADQIDHARLLGHVATGFALAGAAAEITAVVLYFTAPRERLVVVPLAGPTTAGALVGVRF